MHYMVLQDVINEKVIKDVMEQHVDYMHTLLESGRVVVSGPFSDDRKGGMFVLEGESKNEVVSLVEKDPAVDAGILVNEIREYDLKFLRK